MYNDKITEVHEFIVIKRFRFDLVYIMQVIGSCKRMFIQGVCKRYACVRIALPQAHPSMPACQAPEKSTHNFFTRGG